MLSNIEKAYEIASRSSHPDHKVGCYFENTRTGRSIATHNVELGPKLHDIALNGQCLEYIHAEVWASQELMSLPYELREGRITMTYEPCAPCARALLLAGFRGHLEYDEPWLDPALKKPDWRGHKQGITVLKNAGVVVTRSLKDDGAKWSHDMNFGDWYPQCMETLNWGNIRFRHLTKDACMAILEAFHTYLHMGYNVSSEVVYGVTNCTLAKHFNNAVKCFNDLAPYGNSIAREYAYTIIKCVSEAYRRAV